MSSCFYSIKLHTFEAFSHFIAKSWIDRINCPEENVDGVGDGGLSISDFRLTGCRRGVLMTTDFCCSVLMNVRLGCTRILSTVLQSSSDCSSLDLKKKKASTESQNETEEYHRHTQSYLLQHGHHHWFQDTSRQTTRRLNFLQRKIQKHYNLHVKKIH
jgi:hypothetical protein